MLRAVFFFSEDERIKKWCRLMKTIDGHLIELHYNRSVWLRMQEIVIANPAVPASTWWAFLSSVYSKGQAAGVRRIAGSGAGGGASLRPLLEELADDPGRLTREEFLKSWRGGHPGVLKQHEGWWAGEMAPRGGDHVDPAIPQADLAALTAVSERVANYVDRFVAHADPRPYPDQLPTLGDIDAAIDTATDLFQKYHYLLFGGLSILDTRLPDGWEVVFDMRWSAE